MSSYEFFFLHIDVCLDSVKPDCVDVVDSTDGSKLGPNIDFCYCFL